MLKNLILTLCTLLLAACSNPHHEKLQGYIEGRFSYLASNYPGVITKLLVQRGDTVKSGQSLAILNTEPTSDQKIITAPQAGKIFDNYYQLGELVPANAPIFGLLAPANVYLVFFVPEPLLSKLKTDTPIQFSCDGCQQFFAATIRFISPNTEYTPPILYSHDSRQKLVYRVEASVSKDIAKLLHPGQPADVELTC